MLAYIHRIRYSFASHQVPSHQWVALWQASMWDKNIFTYCATSSETSHMPLSPNSLFQVFSLAPSGLSINRPSILPGVFIYPHLGLLAPWHRVDDYAYSTKLHSLAGFSPLSFGTRTPGWALVRQQPSWGLHQLITLTHLWTRPWCFPSPSVGHKYKQRCVS